MNRAQQFMPLIYKYPGRDGVLRVSLYLHAMAKQVLLLLIPAIFVD